MSGLNQPTVHRLLKTLMQEGAVEQDCDTRRYLIGPELSLLGLARTRPFPLLAIADPYLRELAERIGDTVFFSIRHGHDSICIRRHTGHHPIQVLSIAVGARRPLGVGVSGVALLASLPHAESVALVQDNEARLTVLGERPDDVLQRVEQARQLGMAHAPAGLMPGTSALAVPISDIHGHTLGAVTVTAMADRLNPERLNIALQHMRESAAAILTRQMQIAGSG